MGIFGNLSFGAMYAQEKYAESNMDKEHKEIILEKYLRAKSKVYAMWEPEWGKYGSPERPGFWAHTDEHCGPHFIVYGTEPNGKNTDLYPSFIESRLDSIEEKLRRWFNIEVYRGKVSILKPIPILDIMKEITYPKEKIFVRTPEGYPMYAKLGMWRNAGGTRLRDMIPSDG